MLCCVALKAYHCDSVSTLASNFIYVHMNVATPMRKDQLIGLLNTELRNPGWWLWWTLWLGCPGGCWQPRAVPDGLRHGGWKTGMRARWRGTLRFSLLQIGTGSRCVAAAVPAAVLHHSCCPTSGRLGLLSCVYEASSVHRKHCLGSSYV